MTVLNKKPGKDFIVLNLSDFNMSGNEWDDKRASDLCRGTVKELVEKINPELITITGDLAYAGEEDLKYYDIVGSMVDSFNIPWAFVWGNHDNELGYEATNKQADCLMKYSNCIFEKGDISLGSGNYVICIKENNDPIYALILMDTHDKDDYLNPDGTLGKAWGRLHDNQVAWYKKTVNALNLKNTLIIHIPLYVYREAYEKAWNKEYNSEEIKYNDTKNIKYWNKGYENAYGVRHEIISSYPEECGEFNAIKASKLTEIVLAGHSHMNNFIIPYEGVILAQALKTGCGGYWEEELNGGTILRINKDGAKIEHIFIDSKKYI